MTDEAHVIEPEGAATYETPQGEDVVVLARGDEPGEDYDLVELTIPQDPGVVPPHIHHDDDEAFYSGLFFTVPVDDVAPLLADRVSDCSEDQLLRVIWYSQLFTLRDPVENLLLAVMGEGVDDLREAESIQSNIMSALSTSPLDSPAAIGPQEHERELAIVRAWQNDDDLPVDIRNFARKAEQRLLDDLDRWTRFEDDLF